MSPACAHVIRMSIRGRLAIVDDARRRCIARSNGSRRSPVICSCRVSRGLFGDLFGDRFPLPWQMSLAERFVLIATLEHLKPRVAIEIGSAGGGSLQVLAANATQVYALDSDPTTPARLAQFTNVD